MLRPEDFPEETPCIYCGATIYQNWVFVRYTCDRCWELPENREGVMRNDPFGGDEEPFENPEDEAPKDPDDEDEDDAKTS